MVLWIIFVFTVCASTYELVPAYSEQEIVTGIVYAPILANGTATVTVLTTTTVTTAIATTAVQQSWWDILVTYSGQISAAVIGAFVAWYLAKHGKTFEKTRDLVVALLEIVMGAFIAWWIVSLFLSLLAWLIGALAYAASMIAAIAAVAALWIAAYELRQNRLINKERFALDLDEMFDKYSDINEELRSWHVDKIPPAKWREIEDYLGVFEHCERLIEDGLLDWQTFQDMFGYRVRNIMSVDQIVGKVRLDEEDRPGTWCNLIKLAGRLEPEYKSRLEGQPKRGIGEDQRNDRG
jgi:hypothetical protein